MELVTCLACRPKLDQEPKADSDKAEDEATAAEPGSEDSNGDTTDKRELDSTAKAEPVLKSGSENQEQSAQSESEQKQPVTDSSGALDMSRKEPPSPAKPEATNGAKVGSDSDKENVDGPIDLSVGGNKGTSSASSDVIMLSDDDDDVKMNGFVNGLNAADLDPTKVRERRRYIKLLREDLRNEDAKLVLLKKIRQSQIVPHTQDASQHAAKVAPSRGGQHSQPPPLVRGSQQMHNKPASASMQSQHMMQRAHHQQQQAHHHQSHHQQQHHQRSHSQTQGPPPLVMASRQHGATSSAMPHIRSGHHGMVSQRQSQQHSAPQHPQQPEQTPAQRQAAAKLALRKQLEKTLLQIPPPKPPPPEMNFIPSLAGSEFMMLVGLQDVVQYILDMEAKAKGEKVSDVKYVFNPFVCVQCGTDFTPVWKRDKPGSRHVICEQCVTTNQKKALKQEHTNRLKSAFVKALQQEQEIEQKMQAQASSSSSASSAREGTPASSHHSSSHTGSRESGSSSHHHATTTASSSSSTPINLSTSTYKPTSEQLRQHHSLLQAHQAQQLRGVSAPPLGLQAFNQRLAFPFHPQMSSKTAAEIHRQYLLEMIPRSMPAGTVLWRS